MTPTELRPPSTEELRLEMAPPGFGGGYGGFLIGMLLAIAVAGPLALLGVFGALFWDDFPVALRLLMGIVGGATGLVLLWLPIRIVVRATIWQTRIRVRPGGVFVEVGWSMPRKTWWLTPRADVQAAIGDGGIVLSCGARRLRIGFGQRALDSQKLLLGVQRALEQFRVDLNDTRAPEPERLGPDLYARLRGRLRQLGSDLLRPLLRPTPYLLLDLGVMALTPLTSWLMVDTLDWRDAYPIAFVVFIAGLAARRRDGSYIAGLRHYLADDMFWGMKYTLMGVFTGLIAWAAMGPRLGPALALLVAAAAVVLYRELLRQATANKPAPPRNRALDLVLSLTLVPICVIHEAWVFGFIIESSRDLGPLALAFVPPFVLFGYLPLRLHAFIDEPGDRSNVTWFWLTVAALATLPLIGMGSMIARQL